VLRVCKHEQSYLLDLPTLLPVNPHLILYKFYEMYNTGSLLRIHQLIAASYHLSMLDGSLEAPQS
jgi:hypothetical protein